MKPKKSWRLSKLLLWILLPAGLALAGILLVLNLRSPEPKQPPKPRISAAPVLEIIALSGEVEIQRSGIASRFSLGALSPILSGDRIFTSDRAWVDLSWRNRGRIHLTGDSRLLIQTSDSGAVQLELERGSLATNLQRGSVSEDLIIHAGEGGLLAKAGRFMIQVEGPKRWRAYVEDGLVQARPETSQAWLRIEPDQSVETSKREGIWFLKTGPMPKPHPPVLMRLDSRELRPRPRP